MSENQKPPRSGKKPKQDAKKPIQEETPSEAVTGEESVETTAETTPVPEQKPPTKVTHTAWREESEDEPEETPVGEKKGLRAGELQSIPSLQVQMEKSADAAKKTLKTGASQVMNWIRKNWLVTLECIAALAATITAVYILTKEPDPQKPTVKLEEIMDMANRVDPYKRLRAKFEDNIPATEKTEVQSKLLLDVMQGSHPDARWLLVGLPENKSLYLVETKNPTLVEMLDQNKLQVGTKVEVEINPVEKEQATERLIETAKGKNAMPGILRKISVMR